MNIRIPIAREGWPFIIPGLLIFLVFVFIGKNSYSIIFGLLTAGIALFFRDPERNVLQDQRVILSPADGRILQIDAEDSKATKSHTVKIFMSLFDCHINRIPVTGTIKKIDYNPGIFLPAFREKASLLNEQNTIYITGPYIEIGVRQIAGLIARRIVCKVKPGDKVKQGKRFGLIRFGSRVDLFLPPNIDILVKPGQKVKAGKSIIGRIP